MYLYLFYKIKCTEEQESLFDLPGSSHKCQAKSIFQDGRWQNVVSSLFFDYINSVRVCIHIYEGMHMPQSICGGQWTNCGNLFSSITWL